MIWKNLIVLADEPPRVDTDGIYQQIMSCWNILCTAFLLMTSIVLPKGVYDLLVCMYFQINEEAYNKVIEVEQKYNEICKLLYDKRNEIIKSIPDFWLTAVSYYCCSTFLSHNSFFCACGYIIWYIWLQSNVFCDKKLYVQFSNHPALGNLLSEDDEKV